MPQRFNETCNGTLSKPLDVTCVVISGTFQDFPWSLYNSGAAHYDGRPPWWSPLLSSEFPCLVPVNVCRHLQAPPQHQPTATLEPWETFIPPPWNMAAFSQREGDRQNPRNSSTVGLLLRHMSRTQTFPSAPNSQIVTYMVNIDSHTPRWNYWNYYYYDVQVFFFLLAPKVLLEEQWPMITIPSHPIGPTYSSEWALQAQDWSESTFFFINFLLRKQQYRALNKCYL